MIPICGLWSGEVLSAEQKASASLGEACFCQCVVFLCKISDRSSRIKRTTDEQSGRVFWWLTSLKHTLILTCLNLFCGFFWQILDIKWRDTAISQNFCLIKEKDEANCNLQQFWFSDLVKHFFIHSSFSLYLVDFTAHRYQTLLVKKRAQEQIFKSTALIKIS